jgi:hypothetical protein
LGFPIWLNSFNAIKLFHFGYKERVLCGLVQWFGGAVLVLLREYIIACTCTW